MNEKLYIMRLSDSNAPITAFKAVSLQSAVEDKCKALNGTLRGQNIIETPLFEYVIEEKTFNNKLQLYRALKGMSAYDLSIDTGVSIHMIAHYESNHLDLNKARVITVYKLSQALDCEIEDLLD